jgi:hypothetical protein
MTSMTSGWFVGVEAPASNRASFHRTWAVISAEDDTPFDLTGANIVFEISDPETGRSMLSATTANGKVFVPELGRMSVFFTVDEMRGLCPQTYEIACTIASAGETQPFIKGSLPVYH